MSMFSLPSTPSAGVELKTLSGSLLLINVLGVEDHIPTVHSKPGEKTPAVRATLTVLDGPQAGDVHEDTLIFPKVLQSQLNRKVGEMVLGRLGTGVAKPGQSAPWLLAAPTESDIATAETHMRKASTPVVTSAEAPF